jgi:hypothetical protein
LFTQFWFLGWNAIGLVVYLLFGVWWSKLGKGEVA